MGNRKKVKYNPYPSPITHYLSPITYNQPQGLEKRETLNGRYE